MKWCSAVAIIGICCAVTPAQGQDIPLPVPTVRDLYVGCNLAVQRTDVPKRADGRFERFSAAWCGMAALKAIANREGQQPAHKGYTFCLPKTAEISTDPARAMAFAYIDYYERYSGYFETRNPGTLSSDGETFYLAAMIKKWPCP